MWGTDSLQGSGKGTEKTGRAPATFSREDALPGHVPTDLFPTPGGQVLPLQRPCVASGDPPHPSYANSPHQ